MAFNLNMAASCVLISKSTPSADGQSSSKSTSVIRKGVKYLVDTTPNMHKLPREYVLPVPPDPITVSYGAIPVIDLSGLDAPGDRGMLTLQAISSACSDWGAFQITNHSMKLSLMDEMVNAVKGFFNLPLEEKMKYASDNVLDPVRYGTSLNTPKQHDLHWRDYLRHRGYPVHKTLHLWPDCPPNYRVVAKEYLEDLWELALKISGAISISLGLDKDYIEKSLGEGCQIVANNYYPPCPEPHLTLGLKAHSDHGGITILLQNDVEGLQLKHDDKWFAVKHVPGTLLVNLGDYIEVLSNGRYKSVEHRGVVNAERARISIGTSLGPEMKGIFAPADPLVDKNSKIKYTPITYEDYLQRQQSSPIRGKTALDSLIS